MQRSRVFAVMLIGVLGAIGADTASAATLRMGTAAQIYPHEADVGSGQYVVYEGDSSDDSVSLSADGTAIRFAGTAIVPQAPCVATAAGAECPYPPHMNRVNISLGG